VATVQSDKTKEAVSEDEIVAQIPLLLSAGQDTTVRQDTFIIKSQKKPIFILLDKHACLWSSPARKKYEVAGRASR
jgi:hypothetical protein